MPMSIFRLQLFILHHKIISFGFIAKRMKFFFFNISSPAAGPTHDRNMMLCLHTEDRYIRIIKMSSRMHACSDYLD